MSGIIKILIFLILLMLVFWGLNIYRHIRAGGWKGFQRLVDIIGAVLLIGAFIVMLMPALK